MSNCQGTKLRRSSVCTENFEIFDSQRTDDKGDRWCIIMSSLNPHWPQQVGVRHTFHMYGSIRDCTRVEGGQLHVLCTMHVYYAQSMSTMHKGPVTASRLHIIHVAPRQGHLRLETTHPFDPGTLPAVTSDTRWLDLSDPQANPLYSRISSSMEGFRSFGSILG